MLNTRQQRIYEWINDELHLSAYADVFRGAAILLNQRPPGYVTFVAHAGRDIMNGLVRTVRGDVRRQVQYVDHLDKIAASWNDQWGSSIEFPVSEEPDYYDIPRNICVMLRSLIDDHRQGRKRREETDVVFFLEFLRYDDRDKIPRNFMEEWRDAKKGFNEYAHIRKDILSAEVEPQIAKHFLFLEGMLHAAASSQYERIGEINEILDETNR